MKQDEDLRTRLRRAAEGLNLDPDRSLLRFHSSRRRRVAVRRVATIVGALLIAALGLSAAWFALPSGSGRGGIAPASGPSGPSGPSGAIAYMVVTGGGDAASVYRAALEAPAPVEVGTGTFDLYPVWSPDGTELAYWSGDDADHAKLVLADANGAGVRVIVDEPPRGTMSWSPDGSRIAYIRNDPEGHTGAYVVGADGSHDALVIAGDWQSVAWSPDGSRLLLTGYPATEEDRAESSNVYTVRTDGTDAVQLTHDDAYEHFASWSPDGSRIVFARSDQYDDASYPSDVYVMDANGSSQQRLTDWAGFDSFPVWSPDGAWIAFASDRDAALEQQASNREDDAFANISMYVMHPDGSGIEQFLVAATGETLLPASWTSTLGRAAETGPTG